MPCVLYIYDRNHTGWNFTFGPVLQVLKLVCTPTESSGGKKGDERWEKRGRGRWSREGREKWKRRVKEEEEVRDGRGEDEWTKIRDLHKSFNTMPTQASPHTSSHTHSFSLMPNYFLPPLLFTPPTPLTPLIWLFHHLPHTHGTVSPVEGRWEEATGWTLSL